MSVAVLLPGVVSVWPAPAATVAVFDRLPVVAGATVPLAVYVTKLPAPTGTLTFVKERVLPAEPLVPQEAVPDATQLKVTPVIAAGTASVTVAPVAFDGPLFDTTIVYEIGAPGV